ncbi:hypothetical protein [Streptomyces sp. NPDC001502]|uniref:hypothetical protein n=1 Tax=Streptomyces sp. NPDC001502 TaxID=3364578 RepID=UPI0036846590
MRRTRPRPLHRAPRPAPPPDPDDPVQATVLHKTEQLREAQKAGHLDPAWDWDPVDILMFVNQLATSWAGQTDLLPADQEQRISFAAARRTAIAAAVQRLFPPWRLATKIRRTGRSRLRRTSGANPGGLGQGGDSR